MAGKPKLTPDEVIEALAECRGLLFLTAKRLGVSHDTVSRMIRRHPACAEAQRQQRGEFVDEAEGSLWKAVRNGESWAISFTLKCLGRDRGYVERQEFKHDFGDLDALLAAELARITAGGQAPAARAPAPDAGAPAGPDEVRG